MSKTDSKKQTLQFSCQGCKEPIFFSVFDLDEQNHLIPCSHCQKKYAFKEENLKRQLKKFEALCRQIAESQEILSEASVGIDIGEHQVKIPFKLLLTRLNSTLELMIGNQPLSIFFRIEPPKDLVT